MTIPTARKLIEVASGLCTKAFEKDGALQPLWHVVCSSGAHVIMGSPFEKDGGYSKDVVAAVMRKIFQDMDAVAYVFAAESWTAVISAEDPALAAIRHDGIHAHPQRQECLWYTAEDAMGEVTAMQTIEREGQVARLQPLKWLTASHQSEGRFVGMLPVKAGVARH